MTDAYSQYGARPYHRIQVFDASNNYLGCFGDFGLGNGQIRYPHAVAVDPVTGYIVVWSGEPVPAAQYIMGGPSRVSVFTPDGEEVTSWLIGTQGQPVVPPAGGLEEDYTYASGVGPWWSGHTGLANYTSVVSIGPNSRIYLGLLKNITMRGMAIYEMDGTYVGFSGTNYVYQEQPVSIMEASRASGDFYAISGRGFSSPYMGNVITRWDSAVGGAAKTPVAGYVFGSGDTLIDGLSIADDGTVLVRYQRYNNIYIPSPRIGAPRVMYLDANLTPLDNYATEDVSSMFSRWKAKGAKERQYGGVFNSAYGNDEHRDKSVLVFNEGAFEDKFGDISTLLNPSTWGLPNYFGDSIRLRPGVAADGTQYIPDWNYLPITDPPIGAADGANLATCTDPVTQRHYCVRVESGRVMLYGSALGASSWEAAVQATAAAVTDARYPTVAILGSGRILVGYERASAAGVFSRYSGQGGIAGSWGDA